MAGRNTLKRYGIASSVGMSVQIANS